MKQLFLTIFLFLSVVLIHGQDMTTIEFETTTHDFGSIKEQLGTVTTEFRFTNTGKKTFTIGEVKTNCGCTAPAYSTDPVKPGGKGFIKITFNPAGYSGNVSKTISVNGNLSTGPIRLTVNAWIEPRPKVAANDFDHSIGNLRFTNINFALGDIYSTDVDTSTIKFYNAGSKPIKITYIESPAYIRHSKLPIYLLPGQKNEIQIYYSAFMKNELGFVIDRIKIYTDDELVPEKELNIVANIKINVGKMTETERANAARIEFETLEHDFGTLKQGESVSYDFKFTNTGKSTLVIYTVKSSCGCTATTLGTDKIAPGESSVIKVTYSSKNKFGEDQTSVTVYTNDPFNETIKLTLKANVVVVK